MPSWKWQEEYLARAFHSTLRSWNLIFSLWILLHDLQKHGMPSWKWQEECLARAFHSTLRLLHYFLLLAFSRFSIQSEVLPLGSAKRKSLTGGYLRISNLFMMKTMSFKTFTSGEEQQGHKRRGYFQGNWALQLSDYFTMFIPRVKCEMKKSNMNPT